MIKKALVPTDGSEHADKGINYAAQIRPFAMSNTGSTLFTAEHSSLILQ